MYTGIRQGKVYIVLADNWREESLCNTSLMCSPSVWTAFVGNAGPTTERSR